MVRTRIVREREGAGISKIALITGTTGFGDQGRKPLKKYQSHGFGNISYVKLAGEAADGTLFPAGRVLIAEQLPDDNRQRKMLVEYKQAYDQKFNEPISTFGGYAYDALWLVIQALEKVGPNRAKIRDYIESKKDFVGTGAFAISPQRTTAASPRMPSRC